MNPAARHIESASNPTVKAWRSLHKRRQRDRQESFLVEGYREVSRAHSAGVVFSAVLTSAVAGSGDVALARSLAELGAVHYQLGPAAMDRVSFRKNPAAIIAVAKTPSFDLDLIALQASPLLLIADGIEKPGNIGAIVRTADGAGADAVIVSDPVTDLVNPNVIRTSQGAVFGNRIAAGTAAEIAGWLHRRAIKPLAASADANSPLWAADLTGPVALVVGGEHDGLSPVWQACDPVSIPMAGMSDSLNVSVAAAVLLYEARRQRHPATP